MYIKAIISITSVYDWLNTEIKAIELTEWYYRIIMEGRRIIADLHHFLRLAKGGYRDRWK